MTDDSVSMRSHAGEAGHWRGRSIGAGVVGSVVASFCCLPTAVAIALGLSLGTGTALSQLLAYQRLFQVAGLTFAGIAVWWILRRSRATCNPAQRERHADRVPLYVFGAFGVGFAVLNLVVIPLLER
ncbi:MAG: hypothetical protein EPO21_05635 [Chloroflexota bacterium]|nr:MAG: hypothetical protein EPO21_05635 [Chloroflexota bacterium]